MNKTVICSIEELAIAYAAVEGDYEALGWKLSEVSYRRGIAAEHYGDCTNNSSSCEKCWNEDAFKSAKAMAKLLADRPASQKGS